MKSVQLQSKTTRKSTKLSTLHDTTPYSTSSLKHGSKSTYSVILPLPPTLNHTYNIANSRLYKNPLVKVWEQEAGFKVMMTMKRRKPFLGPVEAFLTMFLVRDRDIDSSLKLILDILQKQGVYLNDRQVEALHVFKRKDPDPRIELQVYPLE